MKEPQETKVEQKNPPLKKEPQEEKDHLPLGGFTFSYYFIFKVIIVLAWHYLLDTLGLHTADFKFYSFVLAHSLLKIIQFNYLKSSLDKKLYVHSLASDVILCYMLTTYGLWIGPIFGLVPLIQSISITIMEYTRYKFFEDTTKVDYVVHISEKISDYTLQPMVALNFALIGYSTTAFHPPRAVHFLGYLLMFLVMDIFFGTTHIISHKNHWLWKKHLIHHKYKREDLDTFANFYAELLDGALMNLAVIILPGIVTLYFHLPPFFMCDLLMSALYTHHKYPDKQAHALWFWEWDVIDIILGRSRISTFHRHHHNFPNEHWSAFGIISNDKVFEKIYEVLQKTMGV